MVFSRCFFDVLRALLAAPLVPGCAWLVPAGPPLGAHTEAAYSVNGGDFEGTGTVLNAPAASYYSTGTILYPSANADGSVNLYAVGFADASTSDSVRDVTMVFTPASDNWEFNTGWTLGGSATGVLLINPAATDDAATTEANTPVTLDVLANDEIRQEGATFSDVKLTDDAGERVDEVTVGEDNRITFTPTEGFHGQVPPIEYVAFDSNGKVAFADVVITVNAVVPTAVADEVETGHGEAVTIPVLDNDELGNDGDAWEKVELIDTEGNPVTELVTDEGPRLRAR